MSSEAVEKQKTSVFGKIESIIGTISRILSYIGTGVVVAMMLLTVSDVFLRYAFRRPITGTLELTEYFMVVIAFFALGWCEIQKKHIKVDLLVERFPTRVKAITACITYLIGLSVLIPLTWQNFLRMQHEWDIQRASILLNIPDYPFFLALVIGCTVFILAMVINLAKYVMEAINR